MTEYWKSQARKYCEFCKCWLADNKVSVSFHENGKRHKESVQLHISQLSKKSAKDFKQKGKIDDEMKKMEKAAMLAYMKDVKNNADITSQNINQMLKEDSGGPSVSTTVTEVKPPPVWHEIKTDDDANSYFWNTETNETTWDPPEDYLSLAQQEEQKKKENENEKAKERLKKQKQEEAILEVKALVAREKMKERAVKKEEPLVTHRPSALVGPAPRAPCPYGSWKPIIQLPQEKVDLQLPKVEIIPPPIVVGPEIIKFKEKKVESLGDGLVDFKKRKLNSNFKRNMRQKFDDD